eukprot:7362466-Pyramimonas_sp.AAC.1
MAQRPYAAAHAGRQRDTPQWRDEASSARPCAGGLRASVGEDTPASLRRSSGGPSRVVDAMTTDTLTVL